MYTVTKNTDGHDFSCSEHENLKGAVVRAAELARVTPRTIERRIQKWSHPSGCYQVGGREIGSAGVWIEFY